MVLVVLGVLAVLTGWGDLVVFAALVVSIVFVAFGAFAGFVAVVGFSVVSERVVAILARREVSPSIDLFLSIFYNYNIWRLS